VCAKNESDFQFQMRVPGGQRTDPRMSAAPLPAEGDAAECRCVCGNLVARVVSEGVELKCRRCKRVLLVEVPVGSLERRGSVLLVRVASDSG
jgi:hypothetical protein